jgi:hypothetical protein
MGKKALALARRFVVYCWHKMVSSVQCPAMDEYQQHIKDWEDSLKK